jgi:hypothetical protein
VLRGGAGAKACPFHTDVAVALDASPSPADTRRRAAILSCSACVYRRLGPVCQRPHPRWHAVQPSWQRCAHAPRLRHCLIVLVEDSMVITGHAEETTFHPAIPAQSLVASPNDTTERSVDSLHLQCRSSAGRMRGQMDRMARGEAVSLVLWLDGARATEGAGGFPIDTSGDRCSLRGIDTQDRARLRKTVKQRFK